jgi:tellurite resistance protein TehA-like permease
MFTTGQLVFAVLFFIAFIFILIYSYRGDKKINKKQYKGTLWILLGFIGFIVFLLVVKTFLKN